MHELGSDQRRWVFVRPRNRSPYYDPEIQEPLGLEYLSAARRAAGDQVLVLDCSLDGLTEAKLARRAVSFRPDVIGFSITTAQELPSVLAIHAEAMRALAGREVSWVAGGNFVSTEPAQALRRLPESFSLIRFEGELALEDLAQRLRAGSVSGAAGGLRVFDGAQVSDLDALAFPDRPYASLILESGWAFNLQASRGCCGACRYCSSPGMSAQPGRRWRGRSPASLAEEMEHLHARFGARSFNIVDEDFLGPNNIAHERAAAFAGELKRRGLHLAFGVQVRPDSLTEDIIDLLAEVGLIYVFLGIESDAPEDFRRWGRPYSPDPWRLVRRLRERVVGVNVGALLYHTHSTLASVRRFATTLHQHRLLEYRTARNSLDAMPASYYHTQALQSGEISPDCTGPQPLPYLHAEVETFRNEVLAAIAPLGPPSMHALCTWPPLLARRRFDGYEQVAYTVLMRITDELDLAVVSSFFAVLDRHETREWEPGFIDTLRRRNLEIALKGVSDLVSAGFARSCDELREAIRIDAGL